MESERVVTEAVALTLVRMLAGAPGYPFHPEGEIRTANVLAECSVSVDHARAVMEEFDAEFPTLEQIRNVAYRLREKFDPEVRKRERERSQQEKSDREALKTYAKRFVPDIPGVPWEIALQIQCLRIAHQEGPKDQAYLDAALRDFPEAMRDIRAGREPNPVYVERRYRELWPGVLSAKGTGVLAAMERLTGVTNRDARDAKMRAAADTEAV